LAAASGPNIFSLISRRRVFRVWRDLRRRLISLATGSAGAAALDTTLGSCVCGVWRRSGVWAREATQSSVTTQSAAGKRLNRVVIGGVLFESCRTESITLHPLGSSLIISAAGRDAKPFPSAAAA
jgi:hypothetical protein